MTAEDLDRLIGVLQALHAKVEELTGKLEGSKRSSETDYLVLLEGISLSQRLFGEAEPLLYLRWFEPCMFQVFVDRRLLVDLIGRAQW